MDVAELNKAYVRGIVTACVQLSRNFGNAKTALALLEEAGITEAIALASRDADDELDRTEVKKIFSHQY